MSPSIIRAVATVALTILSFAAGAQAWGADDPKRGDPPNEPTSQPQVQLSSIQWEKLQDSVDRGLKYLSQHQDPNGQFSAPDGSQPAVTSFCVMAFLSRGHVPKQGPYGEQLSRAIDFVISTQRPDGLLYAPGRGTEHYSIVGNYNHAIAGVMLGEVYGMTDASQKKEVRTAIENALKYTREKQNLGQRWADDRGGWRYIYPTLTVDADLSLTAWHLMFYRSARNAEFDIPQEQMDDAVGYVQRCFYPQRGTFSYALRDYGRTTFSRGMAGAGIVSLSLAGHHQSDMAKRAAKFVLENPFDRFNRGTLTREDRFYYGAFYCSQGMFQIGGKEWKQFYSTLLDTLAENQRRDGSWELEANQDHVLGYNYSTSLAILSLTPPFQLLPIYQR